MVGAGAVVTHDVPSYSEVSGNPSRIIGYTKNIPKNVLGNRSDVPSSVSGGYSTAGKGVNIFELPLVNDFRGNLSTGEFERSVPFFLKRYFLVFDVPNNNVRGEHAHKKCHSSIICIKGSCTVVADDGHILQEIILDRPNKGVRLSPMPGVQYNYWKDAVLLVFVSDYYDADNYLRDYDQFLEVVNAAK